MESPIIDMNNDEDPILVDSSQKTVGKCTSSKIDELDDSTKSPKVMRNELDNVES